MAFAGATCGQTWKRHMTEAPLATQPDLSFSVLASAGTGKTWQLVARLTRLLLHDACPDSILAITFTRKAAGEMQERLGARLREMLEADDPELDRLLTEIGESPSPSLRNAARHLYQKLLLSERALRTTTFHSFCQDLLQRFPLEAGLPPGFELAEQTGLLITESWDALFNEATSTPGSDVADALDTLFDQLNSLHNTRDALHKFIEHRSDWWAFTRDRDDPVEMAIQYLEQELELDLQSSDETDFWRTDAPALLGEFAALLDRHSTKTNLAHIDRIHHALSRQHNTDAISQDIEDVFLTGTGSRRKRGSTQAQRKSMGDAQEERFLQIHELFCTRLEQQIELKNRQRTFAVNSAWYRAGQRMLEHYQRIKRERRLLDFADLEWKTWKLLNHPQHAHWIQYKLDQRIDHLLIDEFQDTNPTQWQLILPLLEEMAAGEERARSLFIVGDSKQSIYRFRRGNPKLLHRAADWMEQHLMARSVHLDHSWRSSPAVLEVVNRVFQHPDMQDLLPEYQQHTTHRSEAWGSVEVWPLFQNDDEVSEPAERELRNPLQQPRRSPEDQRHYREGQAIAGRIQQLVNDRVATCDDILILMRSRTHLPAYESALREAGVPYLSLDRGTLLQSLEVRDIEKLLRVLMTPQDNLSLAQVLRSPVFSVTDDDLVLLVQIPRTSWFERLEIASQSLPPEHALSRAHRLLAKWHALTGCIPIHDLLEQIFHESNLMNRYEAAVPAGRAARVQANLTRFIELALEVDSGRYPTLPRFLERLGQLRDLDKEGPDQATPESATGERVRLLTIHASKGLEAPIVFLADSTNPGRGSPGCQTLVRWPTESDRPVDFMLLSNMRQRDSISFDRHEIDQEEEQRESANLLYVAMTRAKHMLIISGCATQSRATAPGWYTKISQILCGTNEPAEIWRYSVGQPDQKQQVQAASEEVQIEIDPRLRLSVPVQPRGGEVAPSHAGEDPEPGSGDEAGIRRGLAIHRMLQLATAPSKHGLPASDIIRHVAYELQCDANDSAFESYWEEVSALINDKALNWLFLPDKNVTAYNEVGIQYRLNGQIVNGVIDRLIKTGTELHIVDYKSHRIADETRIQQLTRQYQAQLALYHEGVSRLWTGYRVRSYLLFTHTGRLIEV
ncbi:MAG: UvrD-helicase domain-containing protein [Thiogranum sp.]|nr:UvrD-helicase domain-containing protein [Thiogranum sp.]